LTPARFLLCDADGNLFPSEGPAFAASAVVTNRLLESLGIEQRYEPEELRELGIGRTFRMNAAALAAAHGTAVAADELEAWVREENAAVTEHLAQVLRPDPDVREPLLRLAGSFELAAVSSSSLTRLDACFRATGLAELFPPPRRFSAEDSLPAPKSKPAPDVYLCALEALGAAPDDALAVEDSVAGVTSARAAGIETVGNVGFVPQTERGAHAAALSAAGARSIVAGWVELEREHRSVTKGAANLR
jgi:beta-phosphoglucomutase-like phosphatase (HAD superfamily)